MAFVVLAQHVTLFTSCKRIRFSGPGDFARLQHLYTTLVVVGLTGMHKTSCSGDQDFPCTCLVIQEPESVKMLFINIHYTLMLAVL